MLNFYGLKNYLSILCISLRGHYFSNLVVTLSVVLVVKGRYFFEIVIAILAFVIELDARKIPGNSGWIMIFTAVFQFCFLLFLLIARIAIWMDDKS